MRKEKHLHPPQQHFSSTQLQNYFFTIFIMNDYIKQAEEFCIKYNTKISIKLKTKRPSGDWKGYTYEVNISRKGKTDFLFNYYDSVYNKEKLE